MNRRNFLTVSAALVAAGCGGSDDSGAAPGAATSAAAPPPAPSAPGTPAAAPGAATANAKSAQPGTLTLHAAQSGTLPFTATLYPLEGSVPKGQSLAASDGTPVDASVVSRWPDGSAAIVVVAGEAAVTAGTPRTLALRPAAAGTKPPLTAARVASLVRNVTINAGGLGIASVSDFGKPERTWWANAQVICCRYRATIDGALEAVIDVHAFASDRALVEVVVENGRLDANAASPARPETKSYTGAVVTVNGREVATVGAPATGQSYPGGGGTVRYAGGHEAFRAWYAASWIGGDPQLEVTHDIASLQAHPLFFRVWKDAGTDFRTLYANDAYSPWSGGRLNVPNMPRGGDMEALGPLSQWDTRYLQTGSRFVRRAVVASALAALCCNVNYRDGASGTVPTHAQASGKSQQAGNWPKTTTEPSWEVAHHPAVGLMAFLCQPSPVFIELAQKIALWNATALTKDGVFGFWAQVRGKAWGIRSLAHAIFLTPDDHPWKAPARASLAANVRMIDAFRTSPNATLGFVWHPAPAKAADFESRIEGMQQPLWMHHWLVLTLHAAERAKLLTGADQTLFTTVADWAARQPVRYVNEARGGEWRLHNYLTTVGRATLSAGNGETLGSGIYAGPTFDALPTYAQNFAWFYTDAPPPAQGAFLFIETDPTKNPNYRSWASARPADRAGVAYSSIFWAALAAAVERQVDGADAAWDTVTRGLTNLAAWSNGFADEPRYNRYPRNK